MTTVHAVTTVWRLLYDTLLILVNVRCRVNLRLITM